MKKYLLIQIAILLMVSISIFANTLNFNDIYSLDDQDMLKVIYNMPTEEKDLLNKKIVDYLYDFENIFSIIDISTSYKQISALKDYHKLIKFLYFQNTLSDVLFQISENDIELVRLIRSYGVISDFKEKFKLIISDYAKDDIFLELITEKRFKTTSEGTVIDLKTKLEWLEGPDEPTSWEMAEAWVDSLGGEWRLPTTDELCTLYLPHSKRKGVYGYPLCIDFSFKTESAYSRWSTRRNSNSAWIFDYERGYYHFLELWVKGSYDRAIAVRFSTSS